jgi:hypothetical protein
MTHSSVEWIMSLNWLSHFWGQVQFGFSICPAVATLENASFGDSMVQLGADHFVRTRQLYVSLGSSQRA